VAKARHHRVVKLRGQRLAHDRGQVEVAAAGHVVAERERPADVDAGQTLPENFMEPLPNAPEITRFGSEFKRGLQGI